MTFKLSLSIVCILAFLQCVSAGQEKGKRSLPQEKTAEREKFKKILEIGIRPGTVFEKRTPKVENRNTFTIESGSISFSEVIPGQDKNLPGSVAIRVFSDGNWRLLLVSDFLRVLDRVERVPASRLMIRSRAAPEFLQFQEGRPIVIARGIKTNPAGRIVLADLRLRLEDQDPVGIYSSQLRITLEVN